MPEQKVCLTTGGCREGGKAARDVWGVGRGVTCEKGLDSREIRVGGEIKVRFSEMAVACSRKTLTWEKGMEAWGWVSKQDQQGEEGAQGSFWFSNPLLLKQ